MTARPTRSGFVLLAGRPNSGKSTLLNRLVGEKISIVTDKPQTTRHVVRGIVNRPEGQIVFLDTPGVHKPIHRMNAVMMDALREAVADVNVLTLIVDAAEPFGRGDQFTLDLFKPATIPRLLLLNKTDKMSKQDLLPLIDRYAKLDSFRDIFPISALTGDGVDGYVAELFRLLPEGPRYYPEDQLTDRPERSLASEVVREKLIERTRDELPYAAAVTVDSFEEGERLHRIAATIHVERETQKGIVIGKAGGLLKDIGTAARLELETMFGRKVHLALRVKVTPGWRDDPAALKGLGLG